MRRVTDQNWRVRRIDLCGLGACVLAGLSIDALGVIGLRHAAGMSSEEHGLPEKIAAGVFVVMALASFLRVGPRGFLAKLGLVHRHGHAPTEPCDDPRGPVDDHGHHDHDHDHDHGHGHDDHPAPAGACPTDAPPP